MPTLRKNPMTTRQTCLSIAQGALLLATLLLGSGCHHQAPVSTAPPVPTTPQGQQAKQQFIQSDPNMPAQERAALQAQMHGSSH